MDVNLVYSQSHSYSQWQQAFYAVCMQRGTHFWYRYRYSRHYVNIIDTIHAASNIQI